MKRKGNRILLAGACVLTLGGCSWVEDWASLGTGHDQTSTVGQPYADRPSDGESGAVTTVTTNERIERLETALAKVNDTLDKMQPQMMKLAGIEDSLEALLAKTEPAAGPVPDEDIRKATPPAKTLPVSFPTGRNTVLQMRIGEHSDKTRLVLDVNRHFQFSYDLDNDSRILLINLPDTAWAAQVSQTLSDSPLIQSYTAQDNGNDGTNLAIQLKQPVQVLWSDTLMPMGDQTHRIVMDLASAS